MPLTPSTATSTRGEPSGIRTTTSPPSRLQVMGSRIASLYGGGLGFGEFGRTFGPNELGPDQVPVVGAEVLTGDSLGGCPLDLDAQLRARLSAVLLCGQLVQVDGRDAQARRKGGNPTVREQIEVLAEVHRLCKLHR